MYHAQIPRDEYRAVCRNFNPGGFHAEAWVKLARDAGMKYIVAMTKHHDGFSMYQSDVTDFNIYDHTEFRRDPIAELYQACEKYGLRLGLYYSHSIDWMDDFTLNSSVPDTISALEASGDITAETSAAASDYLGDVRPGTGIADRAPIPGLDPIKSY